MSIQSNKLMNLADGKVLYDDLRDRLKQAIAIASKADILAIINNYGKQNEEETVVIEMILETAEQNGEIVGYYFKSEEDYDKIVADYLAGKHIVFHFPAESALSDNPAEATVSMIGYFAEYDTGEETMFPSPIEISEIASLGTDVEIDGYGVAFGSKFVVITIPQR